MKAIILLLGLMQLVSCSDIITLTEENFDELVIGSEDTWMIEFYAEYCGHCKNLQPKWEKAATALKGRVKFGKSDNQNLKERFEVQGVPSLRIFHRNFDYGDGQKEQAVLNLEHKAQSAEEFIDFGDKLYDDLIEEEIYAAKKKAMKEKKKKGKKGKGKKNKAKKDDL